MYNHYVRDRDGNYIKVSVEEPPVTYIPAPHAPPKPAPPSFKPKMETKTAPAQTTPQYHQNAPPSHHTSPPQQRPAESQLANKLLGHLNLSDIDSGDLLLLVLLFFLFRQKADEELLIALGLLLIL